MSSLKLEDFDHHTGVDPRSRRLGDGAQRVGDPAAAADHAPEVLVGDADLEEEVAVLVDLLDTAGLGSSTSALTRNSSSSVIEGLAAGGRRERRHR